MILFYSGKGGADHGAAEAVLQERTHLMMSYHDFRQPIPESWRRFVKVLAGRGKTVVWVNPHDAKRKRKQ